MHVDQNLSFAATMTGLLRNAFSLNCFSPRYMMKTAFELTMQSAGVLKRILPESGDKLVWQEFQNKLQAFHLFEHVDFILAISPNVSLNLPEMVSRTRVLGSFLVPWATEGLGHYCTRLRAANHATGRIMDEDTMKRLPPEAMVPLHTGMGLALAETVLERRLDGPSSAETFLQLCRENANPQLLGATIEALGLVVRNLYPELLNPLSQHFWQANQELFEYFWHGVGRGIYFWPMNFLPYWSTPWRGYETCLREPPNDLARRNAVAGFTWAAALVNWLGCAPSDTSIGNLLQYQPDPSHPGLHQLWETQLRKTGEAALHFRPDSVNGTGALFRYHPLSAFRLSAGLP